MKRHVYVVVYALCFVVMGGVLASCARKPLAKRPLGAKAWKSLAVYAEENNVVPYIKASLTAHVRGRQLKTRLSLRIAPDSLLWFSAMPALGIEMFRLRADNTKLQLLNRFLRNYSLVAYDSLAVGHRALPSLSLAILERLFVGRPVIDSVEVLKTKKDIQQTKELLLGRAADSSHKELLYLRGATKALRISMVRDAEVLLSQVLQDTQTHLQLIAKYTYGSTSPEASWRFPNQVELRLEWRSPARGEEKSAVPPSVQLNLHYKQIEWINKNKARFPFSVPAGYAKVPFNFK